MLAWGLTGWKCAATVRIGLVTPVVLAACGLGAEGCHDPRETVAEAMRAVERGDAEALTARIHPAYSDTMGDAARLRAELRLLAEASAAPQLRLSEVEVVRGPEGPMVIGKLEARLAGPPEWTFTGPLRVELLPGDGGRLQIRSGFLDDLRDLRELLATRRAGLEANDARAIGALIHPEYRDGTLDREAAIERLERDLAGVPLRIEPRSYWAEVRGLDAHVDERYILRIDEREHAAVARFTVRRAAGRWRIWAGLYPPGRD